MDFHPDLSKSQKEKIKEKNTRDGIINCAFDKRPIKSEQQVEYHNIDPLIPGTDIEIDNFTTVCKKHHKSLGGLSISEYFAKLEMEEFFNDSWDKRLDSLLEKKCENKNPDIDYELDDSKKRISISFYDSKDIVTSSYEINICPATGFKYFFGMMPFSILRNDNELQPRPLEFKRLFDIYRHLLISPQLTPSICRIDKNKILLFDGQHKAAAQIWAGRSRLECKVYIEPNTRVLKEANLIAHDRLRQMPFFTSVLINKWAGLFGVEWQEYLESKGEKSEKGFIEFLVNKGRKRKEALNMIESDIFDSLIEDKENNMMKYVALPSIMEKRPLTMNKLKLSLLKKFITRPPLKIGLDESDLLREYERKNIIKLLNLLAKHTIEDRWDVKRPRNDTERIYLAGSLRGWSSILRDAIAIILELFDESDKKKIFLRKISEEDWDRVEELIVTLFDQRMFSDDSEDNYDNLRTGSEDKIKEYFRRKGITVNSMLDKSSGEPEFID